MNWVGHWVGWLGLERVMQWVRLWVGHWVGWLDLEKVRQLVCQWVVN